MSDLLLQIKHVIKLFFVVFFFLLLADIDECADISGICRNGLCTNTDGSYQCTCFEGFRLARDGEECIGKKREL